MKIPDNRVLVFLGNQFHWLALIRVILGLFFVVVSVGKILEPYQDFLYVIQNYEVFPSFLEQIIAFLFPWIEFFLGLFFCLGLWLRPMLYGMLAMVGCFILIVGQAIVRQLPVNSCGCFGGLFSTDIKQIIYMDIGMFIVFLIMARSPDKFSALSLDRYFSREKRN